MLPMDNRHYRRLPAGRLPHGKLKESSEVSPFDTSSWWKLPHGGKPPPPLMRRKRYSRGEIERLRQEEERNAMRLEDELSRGAAYALLMQRARERQVSCQASLFMILVGHT